MNRLRMAVIGVGHLGKEHARILAGLPEVELVGVADVNSEQAQAVARRLNTQAFTDYWPLLNLVEAACIVVPTAHHFAVAREFLGHGISLLVEKPLTASLTEAQSLVNLARKNLAVLQVGHIERFNPAFENLLSRPLQPKFINCERLGAFTGRSLDIGVVLDLMIHDLDLLLALVPAPVEAVEALGVSLLGRHEDVATARLRFANGCVANLTASRASPSPRRQMQIWAPEGYAALDFQKRRLTLVQPSHQLRLRGLEVQKLDAANRARLQEELFGRHLHTLEIDGQGQDQLTRELQHFVHCVQTGSQPRVSGEDGHAAVALAQQVLDSLNAHRWDGQAGNFAGPHHLPVPQGALFFPHSQEDAA